MATPVEPRAEQQSERSRAIPAVLAVHFEELASLWAIRGEHVHGPDWTIADLAAWDTRLTAHVDALVIAGDEAIPVLEEALGSDNRTTVVAAALVLLRTETPSATEGLLRAIHEAQGPQLAALADALRVGPIGRIEPRLRELASAGGSPQSLVAFLALAAHGKVDPKLAPGDDALAGDDPHVRQLAWRCIAQVPAHA